MIKIIQLVKPVTIDGRPITVICDKTLSGINYKMEDVKEGKNGITIAVRVFIPWSNIASVEHTIG